MFCFLCLSWGLSCSHLYSWFSLKRHLVCSVKALCVKIRLLSPYSRLSEELKNGFNVKCLIILFIRRCLDWVMVFGIIIFLVNAVSLWSKPGTPWEVWLSSGPDTAWLGGGKHRWHLFYKGCELQVGCAVMNDWPRAISPLWFCEPHHPVQLF